MRMLFLLAFAAIVKSGYAVKCYYCSQKGYSSLGISPNSGGCWDNQFSLGDDAGVDCLHTCLTHRVKWIEKDTNRLLGESIRRECGNVVGPQFDFNTCKFSGTVTGPGPGDTAAIRSESTFCCANDRCNGSRDDVKSAGSIYRHKCS